MGNAFKFQILASVIIVLLVLHNLYLKIELEKLTNDIQTSKHSGGSNEAFVKHEAQVLIYNRIPKTGSTSFMNVAYELFKPNR